MTKQERDQHIAQLTKQGHTAPHIAELLHISTRTVQRARHITGTQHAHLTGPPMSETEKLFAKQLLAEGASYGEVARTLHRCPDSIRKWCPNQSQWTAGSGIEYRNMKAQLEALKC